MTVIIEVKLQHVSKRVVPRIISLFAPEYKSYSGAFLCTKKLAEEAACALRKRVGEEVFPAVCTKVLRKMQIEKEWKDEQHLQRRDIGSGKRDRH